MPASNPNLNPSLFSNPASRATPPNSLFSLPLHRWPDHAPSAEELVQLDQGQLLEVETLCAAYREAYGPYGVNDGLRLAATARRRELMCQGVDPEEPLWVNVRP